MEEKRNEILNKQEEQDKMVIQIIYFRLKMCKNRNNNRGQSCKIKEC